MQFAKQYFVIIFWYIDVRRIKIYCLFDYISFDNELLLIITDIDKEIN
jgi:hypothetical protein